jgi:hypothetical protein
MSCIIKEGFIYTTFYYYNLLSILLGFIAIYYIYVDAHFNQL